MKPSSLPDSPLLFSLPEQPDFSLEQSCLNRGTNIVGGVDEVGRGPLAGPVVTACVVLDPKAIPHGLNDSKKLSEPQREQLFGQIMQCAEISVASVPAKTIDQINILQATLLAMTNAVNGLANRPEMVLVDGRDCPTGLCCDAKTVVKGDRRSLSIAAASIVAKVIRDRQMKRMALIFPEYGFEKHKGYGTRRHLEAIAKHGPCPLHRMSFSPMRNLNTKKTPHRASQ